MNGSGLLGLIIALMWLALPLLRLVGRSVGRRGSQARGNEDGRSQERGGGEEPAPADQRPRLLRITRALRAPRSAAPPRTEVLPRAAAAKPLIHSAPLPPPEIMQEASVARVVFSTPSQPVPGAPQRPEPETHVRGWRRFDRLSELQRAVVYAEIIGLPVSLRSPAGQGSESPRTSSS